MELPVKSDKSNLKMFGDIVEKNKKFLLPSFHYICAEFNDSSIVYSPIHRTAV